MKDQSARWYGAFALMASSLLFVGCGKSGPAEAAASAAPVTVSGEAVEMLVWADAHDGKVDHVVEECATCRLHMKGKESIAARVNDYTLHLCSSRCRDLVQRDPEAVLGRIERE